MRTLTLFTLLFGLTLFFACDDDIATPTNPIDLLPPATQEGNYTFGCLVNGEALRSKSTTDIVAIYQKQSLFISMGNVIKQLDTDIHLSINSTYVNESTYLLNNIKPGRGEVIEISNNGYLYKTNEFLTGQLTISYFDSINYIISGIFSFEALSQDGQDTIRVTNGRFDTHYIP